MYKKYFIKKGDRFGLLTVVDPDVGYHVEPSGHRRKKAKVKCDCGLVYDLPLYNLTRGTSTRCRSCKHKKMSKYKIGDRYDFLVITGFKKVNGRRKVECLCDCGNSVLVYPHVLPVNTTNNCGCAPRGGWSGVGKISSTFFYRIRRNAEVRGLSFDISIEDAWRKYEEQSGLCALSGLSINFSVKTADPSTASLDRIDSSDGYTLSNIQWVHKDINRMKMDLSQDEFIRLCHLVSRVAS